VGGPVEVLDRCRPLLESHTTSDRITHLGGPGTGYTAKLLVNLLWFGQAAATAEALLLGRRAGIDLGVLRDTLAVSAAGSDFIRRGLPSLLAGDHLRSYGLDRIHDQLRAVTGAARDLGTPHEIADTVLSPHRRSLERFGPVDGELLGVVLLEGAAGLRLRPWPPATFPAAAVTVLALWPRRSPRPRAPGPGGAARVARCARSRSRRCPGGRGFPGTVTGRWCRCSPARAGHRRATAAEDAARS
jgi:hypothetical protein